MSKATSIESLVKILNKIVTDKKASNGEQLHPAMVERLKAVLESHGCFSE